MESSLFNPYTVSMVLNLVLLVVSYILSKKHKKLSYYVNEVERSLGLFDAKIRLVMELLDELEKAYADGNISPEEAAKLMNIVRKILSYDLQSGKRAA